MTRSDDTLSGSSQNSTPPRVEMVICDRRTLNKVLRLISNSCDDVSGANHCEIMLFALNDYLSEEKDPDVNKSLLFLRYWLHVVPELLKGTLVELDEAHAILKAVLDATR